MASLCVLAPIVGCAEDDSARASSASASVPDAEALYALSAGERRALFARVEEELTARAAKIDAVAATRAVQRLANASVRLGDSPNLVADARGALKRLAAHAAGVEACTAMLGLARLEATAAFDLARAYAVAERLVERFGERADCGACVVDARRITATLEDYRGGPELAPTLATRGEGGAAPQAQRDGVGEHAVADFVRRRGDAEAAVTLEEIAIYGADAAGERPLSRREVRVVLRFDGPAIYRRGERAATAELPRRISLDLDEAKLSPRVPEVLSVEAGGLERVRVFPLSADRTRLSFDVGERTAYRLFFLDEPYRVIMDFRDEGLPGAASGGPLVVLDPGHGGEQPGAKGPDGLKESTVALSLARRVRAALRRARPEVTVLLTRDEDVFLTLEERTAIANGYGADLFVSIHLNASPSAEDHGGVATFVLDTTNDQAALRLAARENGTDAAGVSELQFILASLYRRDQVSRSLALAELVHARTLARGRRLVPALYDRGVKRALFYVLVGARMPAVLVEASFITNAQEAAALHTDAYRDALAEGIAEGIHRYLDR